MSVCAGCRLQTADNTLALSHVFPLERASVQGFAPSIIFSISVFYLDLNGDFLHIPLLSFLTMSRLLNSFFTHSLPQELLSSFLLKGAEVSAEAKRQSQISGGSRCGAEGEIPIFSLISMYGHSAKVGKMYGAV